MLFEKLLKSKSGQEESGKAVRGAVIGIIMVMAIASIMFSSSTIFAAEGGQGAADSIANLAETISYVANTSNNVSRAVVESVSLKDGGYVFAFFDLEDPFAEDTCQSNEKFWKPAVEECSGSMCVCICDEDEACTKPVDCKAIKGDGTVTRIVGEPFADFLANLGNTVNGKTYVLIYSNCDGWGGEPLGVQDILIERSGKTITISNNACGNKVYRGNTGVCTKQLPGRPPCAPGETVVLDEKYKCGGTDTCCIKA